MHADHEHRHHKRDLKHKLHETLSGDRTRTPRQKRSIETRNLIIQASMKLFSEKGYHSTNTKEIAAEAGVATGCFYSYFTDKRDVFLEALKIYNQQFNDILQQRLDRISEFQEDKRNFLREIILGLLEAHKVFSEFHNELQAMKFSDPDIHKIMEDEIIDSRKNTLQYMLHWKDEIKVSDLEAAAVVIFDLIDNIVDTIMDNKTGVEDSRLIHSSIDMVFKYLFE